MYIIDVYVNTMINIHDINNILHVGKVILGERALRRRGRREVVRLRHGPQAHLLGAYTVLYYNMSTLD